MRFDRELRTLYKKESQFGNVVATFAILALIITGMGLFGLAMLIAERRLKEMTIRKVFGASGRTVMYLIQKEFIIYFLISVLVAIPLSWYFSSLWLENFFYRSALRWPLFVVPVILAFGFVSLILYIKTRKVARESPADVLKYE
jgi:putative ABC transport system permease protein